MSKSSSINFWNTCPLELENLPQVTCNLGKPKIAKDGKVSVDPQCEWWINSPKHHYCFWKYIQEKSNPDGSMNELLQSDLAKLFGCSSTKIHFLLKEAMQQLKEKLLDKEIDTSDAISDEESTPVSPIDFDPIDPVTEVE